MKWHDGLLYKIAMPQNLIVSSFLTAHEHIIGYSIFNKCVICEQVLPKVILEEHFNISPGSAEKSVRRGGITNHYTIAYSLSNILPKITKIGWCALKLVCNISVVFRQCIYNQGLLVGPKRLVHVNWESVLSESLLMKWLYLLSWSQKCVMSIVLCVMQFTKTIICQSHLCPLPLHVAPVYWTYDFALHMYPLPDLIVCADKYDPFTSTQVECTVTNPVWIFLPQRNRGMPDGRHCIWKLWWHNGILMLLPHCVYHFDMMSYFFDQTWE